jgi:hypothetical protein
MEYLLVFKAKWFFNDTPIAGIKQLKRGFMVLPRSFSGKRCGRIGRPAGNT